MNVSRKGMNIVSPPRIGLFLLRLLGAAVFCVNPAWGATTELSDPELGAVFAQGLITLSNSSLDGLNFSTVTLNANISLNANLTNLQLGTYPIGGVAGSDINVPLMEFGRSDGSTAQQTVQLTNPYVQLVTNPGTGAGKSQVVGFRVGFGGMSGDIGLTMNDVSGNVVANASLLGIISLGGFAFNGSRQTQSCGVGGILCLPLANISGLTAGNSSGPCRDYWISMLSQPVQFPAQPGLSLPAVAQVGAWLNWTDRLSVINGGTGYNLLGPASPPANVMAALRR